MLRKEKTNPQNIMYQNFCDKDKKLSLRKKKYLSYVCAH